jgi:hypothetical protein
MKLQWDVIFEAVLSIISAIKDIVVSHINKK